MSPIRSMTGCTRGSSELVDDRWVMRLSLPWVLCAVASVTTNASAEGPTTTRFGFGTDPPGRPPAGFAFGRAGGGHVGR